MLVVKITVLYGHPMDPEAFEAHYASEHAALVGKMPNLARFEAARVVAVPDGGEPPFYRTAELWFESAGRMQESLASPEGQAVVADIPNFATGGATTLVCAVDEA
jgi:uncharacterized protein (TIGR02118 family)